MTLPKGLLPGKGPRVNALPCSRTRSKVPAAAAKLPTGWYDAKDRSYLWEDLPLHWWWCCAVGSANRRSCLTCEGLASTADAPDLQMLKDPCGVGSWRRAPGSHDPGRHGVMKKGTREQRRGGKAHRRGACCSGRRDLWACAFGFSARHWPVAARDCRARSCVGASTEQGKYHHHCVACHSACICTANGGTSDATFGVSLLCRPGEISSG